MKMIKRLAFLLLILVLLANDTLAQNPKPDVCTVGLVDYSGKNIEEQIVLPVKRLGTFETVVGEEERTVRSFRIPGTKLFAVASVFYTDESMRLEDNFYSISLELTISRRAKRDPLNSLYYAEAEAMSVTPNVARVSTLIKIRGRPTMIVMECRREAAR